MELHNLISPTGSAVDAPRGMSVVRLITRLNVGGPARQALLLTRELGDGFPTVLAAGRPTAVEGELADDRVPVVRLPLVRPLNPSMDARAIAATRRLLQAAGARVLHTHMAKAGTVGRIAASSMTVRPRTVHTFHGHVLDGYFKAGTQRMFIELERALARRTDVLVAVSPEVRDSLQALGIGRRREFHVIPLGLDLDRFLAVAGPDGSLRASLGVGPATPLIGVVGRLVSIKAVEVALEAVARLPEVHLAVIGDGEERASLTRQAQSMGLAGRVHFTGWWTDVPAAMSDLDLVVLTSKNEGTPVALIEAHAAGKPVVATDVGGVRHVVTDGVTGWLAPSGDAPAIAALIEQALHDRDRLLAFGAAGRVGVRDRFGKDRLLRDIGDLYTELLTR
jgi:glycosyltransferase involved in cell wall biosynthesis